MNEADWLSATDPSPMLAYLRGVVSERKRYLFACACWRRVLAAWPHPRALEAVATGERFADGEATEEEVLAALTEGSELAIQTPLRIPDVELLIFSARALSYLRSSTPSVLSTWIPIPFLARMIHWIAAPHLVGTAENGAQADLMRHIMDNPFRRVPIPAAWPGPVLALAEAVYVGEDVVFALHDALLDAGQASLAEHFREPSHPKGCWALDLILGKAVRHGE